MIAIVSNQNDLSSKDVEEWLCFYGHSCYFLDNIDFEAGINIWLDNKNTSIKINALKVESIWFRRLPVLKQIIHSNERISNHLNIESKQLLHSLFGSCLNANIPVLGTNKLYNNFFNISKVYSLLAAKDCGIHVPATLITTSKKDVKKFLQKHKHIISKPLHSSIFIPDSDSRDTFAMYASLVTKQMLQQLDNYFHPCIFQQYIPKKFEIRSFILNDKCYSSAIFSQKSKKTKIDFRNYDDNNPNRVVPYKLPYKIEKELLSLFDSLGLNTGSVDIILDKNNRYVFLEINPVGQFGMVSFPCNYYLEEKISLFLINNT